MFPPTKVICVNVIRSLLNRDCILVAIHCIRISSCYFHCFAHHAFRAKMIEGEGDFRRSVDDRAASLTSSERVCRARGQFCFALYRRQFDDSYGQSIIDCYGQVFELFELNGEFCDDFCGQRCGM